MVPNEGDKPLFFSLSPSFYVWGILVLGSRIDLRFMEDPGDKILRHPSSYFTPKIADFKHSHLAWMQYTINEINGIPVV